MKQLLFTIIILTSLVACDREIEVEPLITNVQENQLNGKVKQMTETKELYNLLGTSTLTTTYYFDEKGFYKIVEEHLFSISENDTVDERRTKVCTFKDPMTIEEVTTNQDGEQIDFITKKIDKKGRVLRIKAPRVKLYFTYNKEGTKATVTSKRSVIDFKGEITYDAKGRVIVEENRMRALFNTAARTAYTYNDKGFEATKITEDLYTKEETNIYYEYQYDTYGSAIEVKEYKNGKLESVAKRTIEYYK